MILKIASIVIALSLVAMAASLGYMAGDRTLPTNIRQTPIVNDNVSYPGGRLEVKVSFVQTKRCDTHVDRFLFDSHAVRYTLQPIDYEGGAPADLGTVEDYSIKIPIPKDASIGPAKYETVSVYRCNMIHYLFPLYGPVRDIPFTIRPRKDGEQLLEATQ
jgi:hypothetical protein